MAYSLTPETDPTAFKGEDGKIYHLCDLPTHTHNVPFPYADCNEEYWKYYVPRVSRLREGYHQFGCGGKHHGYGTKDCPRELHHHHDIFCDLPTELEIRDAGIDPKEFRVKSRA